MANHPPRFEPVPDGKLFCFLNKERICGADCMAFDIAPVSDDYKDRQWGNCLLLVNAHRAGKHLVVLASLGADLLKKVKTEAADKVRTGQTPPPQPK